MKRSEVDFSEAFAFDEQDKMEAELAAQDGKLHETGWNVWQRAKNLVFGKTCASALGVMEEPRWT